MNKREYNLSLRTLSELTYFHAKVAKFFAESRKELFLQELFSLRTLCELFSLRTLCELTYFHAKVAKFFAESRKELHLRKILSFIHCVKYCFSHRCNIN